MSLDFIVASTASQITFSLTLHKIGCGLAKRYKAANCFLAYKIGCGLAKRYKAANCFLAFALALRYLCIKLWLDGNVVS